LTASARTRSPIVDGGRACVEASRAPNAGGSEGLLGAARPGARRRIGRTSHRRSAVRLLPTSRREGLPGRSRSRGSACPSLRDARRGGRTRSRTRRCRCASGTRSRGTTPPVRGVERVDVDVSAEGVEGAALERRFEAVDRAAAIRVAPVERVVAPVRPSRPYLELRQRAAPMRQAQLQRASCARRRQAIVGQRALPALQRPVAALRGTARRDEPTRAGLVPAGRGSGTPSKILGGRTPSRRSSRLGIGPAAALSWSRSRSLRPRRGRVSSCLRRGR
jgi:hypothetical protein